jgi:spore maturation protein CgeB
MKILCLFGKHQYGNPQRGESTENFSFMPALRELGHKVTLFDSWNKSLYPDFFALNCALVDECNRSRPDIILWVALTVEIWLETLDYLRSTLGIRIIHWAPDDSWKFYQHSQFIASHVDLCVTTYPEFLPSYKRLGAQAIASGWGVPEEWRGRFIPASDCRYDVSFIGTAQQVRKNMIANLNAQGINVICYGYGWPSGIVSNDKMLEIIRNSRISLNFANSFGSNQTKARIFEITGAGGFLLTQESPGLNLIFDVGREIIVFNNLVECAAYIRLYLHNEAARDSIANLGNQRTQMEYTYTERLKKVLSSLPVHPEITVASFDESDFKQAAMRHKKSCLHRYIAQFFVNIGIIIFGRERGPRFARRVSFEISWRVFGKKTYKSSGLVGRMFYEQ